MSHGAGGVASRRLVEEIFRPLLSNPALDVLGDAAIVHLDAGRVAFTTDSFVVRPLQFPGGSIGELAVNGTVNDLAVSGARPLALAASFVLEAGLEIAALRAEVEALARAARRAGVPVVTGDTKVVENGKADGMYITTSGIGGLHPRASLAVENVREHDAVVLSGPIGSHGIAVLLARAALDFESDIRSDSRPLTALTHALLDALGDGVRWMRDATRGGVATVLNELATGRGCAVSLDEDRIPVEDAVRGACELLGLDPLHVANEGQFVAVVSGERVEEALQAMRATPGGSASVCIGHIQPAPAGAVLARSAYGTSRVVDMLIGDPLPRIC